MDRAAAHPRSRSSWHAPCCSPPRSAPSGPIRARRARSSWPRKSRAATPRIEILELYLNEIYYGNLAYGIEAASETYFGKTANQLTLAEASFLAGLPQSPSVYDIYTNRDVTLARQQQVLVLMYGLSQTEGCIKVSNSEVPICVDEVAAANAANEMKAARLQLAQH